MSRLTYRSLIYRGVYAVIFASTYLLFAAYLLSGDDSGSESNTGIWRLLVGLVLVGLIGVLAGPALHRRVFKQRKSYRRPHSNGKRSS
jgi:hypothetical protein